jgi:hypothetical protein
MPYIPCYKCVVVTEHRHLRQLHKICIWRTAGFQSSTQSRIRSQIWPGTSSSMWFFEVAIPETTIRIFKSVWKILPIQPITQTWEKHQHPPFFFRRWEHFSKIGSRGSIWNCGITETTRADFWNMFSSSFENDPPFMSKKIVLCMYTQPRVYTAVLVLVDLNLDLLNLVDPACGRAPGDSLPKKCFF